MKRPLALAAVTLSGLTLATLPANAPLAGAKDADYRLAPDSPLQSAGEALPTEAAAAKSNANVGFGALGS